METWMRLEANFLTSAADKLAENLDRIEACLSELPPHSLWARDSENENAVGNLLLHLEGNVRQWILSGIGARPDERDRPSEFSARTGASASVLFAKLRDTVSEAVALIRSLPHGRLGEDIVIQGYDTTVLSAIFHVVEHFSGHTYQIIQLTKRFTGKDLGFYSYLDKTRRQETAQETRDPPVNG
jgi:uncharacterized damage-inducible protein DinB